MSYCIFNLIYAKFLTYLTIKFWLLITVMQHLRWTICFCLNEGKLNINSLTFECFLLIWQHVTQVSLPSNTVSAHRLHNGSVHSPAMRAFLTSKQQETEAIKAARPEEPQPSSLAHRRMHSADCQRDACPDSGGKIWQNNGCKLDRNDCAPRAGSWFVL